MIIATDEDYVCPVCFEQMDETDSRLFPCRCGFQLCMWCLDQIENKDNRCPNCRESYDRNEFRVEDACKSEDGVKDIIASNGDLTYSNCYNQRGRVHNERCESSNHPYRESTENHEEILSMRSVRIVKRNLVYIVGMPLEESDEALLKSEPYFGRYGVVQKVVCSSTGVRTNSVTTVGLYLTYETDESALSCIMNIDGTYYRDHILKASFGTTKYCNSFIHGNPCLNPDCLYLHSVAPTEDCFSRDQMTIGDYSFYKRTHPGTKSTCDSTRRNIVFNNHHSEYYSSEACNEVVQNLKNRKSNHNVDNLQFVLRLWPCRQVRPMGYDNMIVSFGEKEDQLEERRVKMMDDNNERREKRERKERRYNEVKTEPRNINFGMEVNLNDLFRRGGDVKESNGEDDVSEEKVLEEMIQRSITQLPRHTRDQQYEKYYRHY